MKTGTVMYNPQMVRILQVIGLVLPIILLLYGLMIAQGYASSLVYSGVPVLCIILGSWLAFSLYQFAYNTRKATNVWLTIAAHHVFALTFAYCITGFDSPVISSFALLYFMSYMFFSHRGLAISIIAVVLGWIIYALTHFNPSHITSTEIVTLGTSILIGLTAISLSLLQADDRKKLEQSKQHALRQEQALSAVMNSTTQAIMTVSSVGKIKLYNAALLNLMDTNTGLENANVDTVLSLVDQNGTKVSLFELMKTKRHFERDDLSMQIDENDRMRLHINVNNIQPSYSDTGKKRDEYVCIMRDITKEKSLDDERDEFISVASHELRTPIAIAEGTLSNTLMMFGRKDVSEQKMKDSVSLAHEQVRFLASMVNDLSTLSRAERGVADDTEKLDIWDLAQKLYQEYAPQAKDKGLAMDLDVQTGVGTVTASRLYLEELLQNLITNAIKYTKEGTVVLKIHRVNTHVELAVKDTGIGISKSDQAKIFNKFYRSEDYRTRETGGTGLGLYVAAKLAQKLGTKIEIKSRLNHGSTFSITI